MKTDQMTCAEAEPLLPLVADGVIDPDSDPSLFAHLADCPDCQRMIAGHDLIALAIARPAVTPPRRNPILQLWPLAAAAVLALSAAGWMLTREPVHQASPSVVTAPGPAPAVMAIPAAVVTPAASTPDVIAIPHADGRVTYLVRHEGSWVDLDPAALDGPALPTHGSGSGVQVRY